MSAPTSFLIPVAGVRPVSTAARRLCAVLWVVAASSSFVTALHAQDNSAAADEARRRRSSQGQDGQQGRGNFNPEDVQARLMNAMRDRLEITDDEEWKLISERVSKVMELRRTAGGGGSGFAAMALAGRGAQGPTDPNRSRSSRSAGGNTEMAALQSAIRDKLPDAEVKSRLDRLRETRKTEEAKLVKAQEELRAVLSVRQEAVAVMFGLLP